MKISEPSTSHLLLYPALTILKIIGQSCLINSRVEGTPGFYHTVLFNKIASLYLIIYYGCNQA